MRVQRPGCGLTGHFGLFVTRIRAAARWMGIGWVVEPGRVRLFSKSREVKPGGAPLAQGRGEWMGRVVHHDREGKGWKERELYGYKRGGIIGNYYDMWMVGKRKGMTALRATNANRFTARAPQGS